MAIYITDPDLEKKIKALGARQPIPVKKTTLAKAILRAAIADDRGGPVHKWKDRSKKFSPAATEAA